MKLCSNKKVKALLKAFRNSFILSGLMWSGCILVAFFLKDSSPLYNEIISFYFLMVSILSLMFVVVITISDYSKYINEEEKKESKVLIEELLSKREVCEVVPIKLQKYDRFIYDLSNIAKLYVRDDKEDNDYIEIFIMFNDSNKECRFQKIKKELFTSEYKLNNEFNGES